MAHTMVARYTCTMVPRVYVVLLEYHGSTMVPWYTCTYRYVLPQWVTTPVWHTHGTCVVRTMVVHDHPWTRTRGLPNTTETVLREAMLVCVQAHMLARIVVEIRAADIAVELEQLYHMVVYRDVFYADNVPVPPPEC